MSDHFPFQGRPVHLVPLVALALPAELAIPVSGDPMAVLAQKDASVPQETRVLRVMWVLVE